jgi:hypothetical protein
VQNYLIHSARTNKNLTEVIVPSTRRLYHACFPIDNSTVTELDIHVFEIKCFKCGCCAVYSITITTTTKLYCWGNKIISDPIKKLDKSALRFEILTAVSTMTGA